MITEIETKPAPLAVPEIPVVETEYDRIKANRDKLFDALKAKGDKQIFGALQDGEDMFCVVGLGDAILRGRA